MSETVTTKECLIDQCAPTEIPSTETVDKVASELRISPKPGFAEVGKTWQFQAQLIFSDGSAAQDVTDDSLWSSSDEALATIGEATGIATAVGAGSPTISASYHDSTYGSFMTTTTLEVVADDCVHADVDWCLVLDRSGSMTGTDIEGKSREDWLKDALTMFFDRLDWTAEAVGIVSFAGKIRINQLPLANTTEAEATLDQTLNMTQATVEAVAAAYEVRSPCVIGPQGNGQILACATGIGQGLQLASDELTSSRHRAGVKQVVVLFTDGANDIALPDPETVATAIKAAGILIVVVALDPQSFNSYEATLTGLATTNLYYSAAEPEGLAAILAEIPYVICTESYIP